MHCCGKERRAGWGLTTGLARAELAPVPDVTTARGVTGGTLVVTVMKSCAVLLGLGCLPTWGGLTQ